MNEKEIILEKIDDMLYNRPYRYAPHNEGYILGLTTLAYWIEHCMSEKKDDN